MQEKRKTVDTSVLFYATISNVVESFDQNVYVTHAQFNFVTFENHHLRTIMRYCVQICLQRATRSSTYIRAPTK
jgi:hypothetical protein